MKCFAGGKLVNGLMFMERNLRPKLKNCLCNMKEKIHEFDKIGAIYEVKCMKHNSEYNGETNGALKE